MNKLALYFTRNKKPLPSNDVYGLIFKKIKRDWYPNIEYRNNNFSGLSTSGLLGGRLDNETINFPNGAMLIISSTNRDMLFDFLMNIQSNPEIEDYGMKFTHFEPIFEEIKDGLNKLLIVSPLIIKASENQPTVDNKNWLTPETSVNDYNDMLTEEIKFELTNRYPNETFNFNTLKCEILDDKVKERCVRYSSNSYFLIGITGLINITADKNIIEKIVYEGLGKSPKFGWGHIGTIKNLKVYNQHTKKHIEYQ